MFSLLVGCTPIAADPAECGAGPTIVALSPGGAQLHAGLSSRDVAMPGDLRELVSSWREVERRPACSGESDVVVAEDAVDAVVVLATLTGLQGDCERPTRVALRPGGDPVPLAGVHFCGCRAAEPLAACSTPELDVREGSVRTRQRSRLRGGEDCGHGSLPMVSISQADRAPQRPPDLEQVHPNLGAAVEAIAEPHADLPACRDALVRVDGASSWGEVRETLQAFADRADYRITLDLAQ